MDLPFFKRLEADLLHEVDLGITSRYLNLRIIIGHNNISAVSALYIPVPQIIIRAMTSHPQVTEIIIGKTGYECPFLPTDIYIEVSCDLIIGIRIPRKGNSTDESFGRK